MVRGVAWSVHLLVHLYRQLVGQFDATPTRTLYALQEAGFAVRRGLTTTTDFEALPRARQNSRSPTPRRRARRLRLPRTDAGPAAPAADPPGCVGGVRRWRFPLTGSTGCVCVDPRASSSASAAGSLAPLYYNCTRLYRSKHILTQSNTGKAGPQPSLPGPI